MVRYLRQRSPFPALFEQTCKVKMPPKAGRGRPSKAVITSEAHQAGSSRAGASSRAAQAQDRNETATSSPAMGSKSPSATKKQAAKSPTTSRVAKRPSGKAPRVSNIQRKCLIPITLLRLAQQGPCANHPVLKQPVIQRLQVVGVATNPAQWP